MLVVSAGDWPECAPCHTGADRCPLYPILGQNTCCEGKLYLKQYYLTFSQ